jgi:hypothetical protein
MSACCLTSSRVSPHALASTSLRHCGCHARRRARGRYVLVAGHCGLTEPPSATGTATLAVRKVPAPALRLQPVTADTVLPEPARVVHFSTGLDKNTVPALRLGTARAFRFRLQLLIVDLLRLGSAGAAREEQVLDVPYHQRQRARLLSIGPSGGISSTLPVPAARGQPRPCTGPRQRGVGALWLVCCFMPRSHDARHKGVA